MKTAQRTALLALAGLVLWGGRLLAGDLYDNEPARADDVALPRPAEVVSLASHPTAVALKGIDDARQLVITAALSGDRLQDLSGDVRYEVADPKVARVSTSGRVVPLANGATTVTATYGNRSIAV